MELHILGFNETLEKYRTENNLGDFEIGRVVAEHRERYLVMTEEGEFEAEITGNLRYSAQTREDFPAVGDWVALIRYDTNSLIIQSILPRQSLISRTAVGKFGEKQIIATNIDYGLLVQAMDRDFNINRLDRYLTICYSSGVKPIIVLTKSDLADQKEKQSILNSIQSRLKKLPVYMVSNETMEGLEDLKKVMEKGKTYCLLGSSGVGKSTLMNNLSGKQVMKTGAISTSTHKGKHVTSHRELIVLDTGSLMVDNPGMREIGIADSSFGLEITFQDIETLAERCKFKDCNHTNEQGCAVLEAVENGEIQMEVYENFLKLEREKDHYELSELEKRKKDKAFGKMFKNVKKDLKKFNPKYKK